MSFRANEPTMRPAVGIFLLCSCALLSLTSLWPGLPAQAADSRGAPRTQGPGQEGFPSSPKIPLDGAGRYFTIAFDGEVIGTSMTVPSGNGIVESKTTIDLSRIDGSMAMEFHAREERGADGRLAAYSSRSTTTAGILETSFTVKGKNLVARAKLPKGTEKVSTQRTGEADFHVLDNNIYGQVASIVEKWAPECESSIRVKVFIPSFMKFKDLQMERLGDGIFSLSIGSQLILARVNENTLATLDFPLQMFTAISCGPGEFSSAAMLLAATDKGTDIVDFNSPGPDRFSLSAAIPAAAVTGLDLLSTPWYNHSGRVTGGAVSGTWTRSANPAGAASSQARGRPLPPGFPAKALASVTVNLARNALNASRLEKNDLANLSTAVYPEVEKILKSSGLAARVVFGLAIAGNGADELSLFPATWVEAQLPEGANSSPVWTPVDPIFNLHPGRYIRMGLGNHAAAPKAYDPAWGDSSSAKSGGAQFPEGPESGRFILRLEGSDTIGVAAYDMRKFVDFTKGFKTLSATASTFFAFGNLEAKKDRGRVDTYSYTFVAKTSTEYDPETGFRSLSASSKSSQGEGDHSLAKRPGGLEIVTRSGGKEVFRGFKKGEWSILEPWNLSHWRKIFSESIGKSPGATDHRLRTVNPFSTGKGLSVYLDLFVSREEGSLTVRAPIYGMTFRLDPDNLRILGFSDGNTRIIGIPVDEPTYMGTASELSAKARFNVVDIGLR